MTFVLTLITRMVLVVLNGLIVFLLSYQFFVVEFYALLLLLASDLNQMFIYAFTEVMFI